MIRFDERRLKQNDGDDFRDFVGEFLRASGGFGRPIPRDAGSVDGCIDLYCDSERLVVECKFIGADVKDESARVDQEWRSVRDKLDENLKSQDAGAAPSRAPYRPWADAERPIKRYVFATSARLANESKQREIATKIQDFFLDDLGERPGYEHLRLITVEVIDWTNITTQLVDHPALVFKWLKQWPEGFAELDDQSPTGFRAFLYSEKLPYLARDSWRPPDELHHSWTETSLIEEIAQPEGRDPIVVLIGHGGVGKTRLGLECARRMRRLGWWTIRCNGLLAKTTGLRQLLQESPAATRVLLFVDYLETWPAFEAFANDVLELNQSSGHEIRIIATCRASYRDRLATFMKPQNIGGGARIEAAYSDAVTRHILSTIGTTDIEGLVEKCRGNFALAAFLAFLKHEKPEGFAVELSELTCEPSFEAWIVRRLQNAGLKDISAAAAIFAACEFETKIFSKLAEAHGSTGNGLLRVLVADKWIERREPNESGEDSPLWAAFHDIFADVVLARALDIAPDRDDAIDKLLEQAVTNGVFRQTLISLGRLKQFDVLATVDWCHRLLELERRKLGTLGNYARLILASSLLTPENCLNLIALNSSLEKAIGSDPGCDLDLARTAAAISADHFDDEPGSAFNQILVPLLDTAVARGRQGNIILRLAFSVRPERYRDVVQAWLVAHPDSFQTHFLLKSWLDQTSAGLKVRAPESAAHINSVGPIVTRWLAAFSSSTHATFVLKSWLHAAALIKEDRAADMASEVADHVTYWLAHGDNAISRNAEYVYAGWLEAAASIKGELAADMIERVADHVTDWLLHGDNAISEEAAFIYSSWLRAGASVGAEFAAGMVKKVADQVTNWLAHEDRAITEEAGFVYSRWLETAALVEHELAAEMIRLIAEDLTDWLARGDHAIGDRAGFIYARWFKAAAAINGDQAAAMVEKFKHYLVVWLAYRDNAMQPDTDFIYTTWLEAAAAIKGDAAADMVSQVKAHVVAWLKEGERSIKEKAMFIYKPWLEAASRTQLRLLSGEILTWILAHQDSSSCDFVLESWLDKGLEFSPVADACFRAVRRLYDNHEAAFILKHVVRQQELPADVVLAALYWCARFPDHEDVVSRLGPLISIDSAEIVGAHRLTKVAGKVLHNVRLETHLADVSKRAALRALLARVFEIGNAFPAAEKLARIYFARWLHDGRLFRPLIQLDPIQVLTIFDQRIALVEALLTLMTYGEFRPATSDQDRAVLEQFCCWVEQWTPFSQRTIAALIEELSDRFGLPQLWQQMLPK